MQDSDEVDMRHVEGNEEEGEHLGDGDVEDLLSLVIYFPAQHVELVTKYCLR